MCARASIRLACFAGTCQILVEITLGLLWFRLAEGHRALLHMGGYVIRLLSIIVTILKHQRPWRRYALYCQSAILVGVLCKGAVVGFVGSAFITVWLSVGSLRLTVKHPTLPPVGIGGCEGNATIFESAASATPDVSTVRLLTTTSLPSVSAS